MAPAPWPELKSRAVSGQRDAASRRMVSCRQGTTNPSRTRAMLRRWKRLSWVLLRLGGCACTVPYLLQYPNHGRAPGTRHTPSLLLVRILYGGQSNWQAGRWAMSSPFLSLQISRTSSAPRFASVLQSIEVQRLVESKGRCHLPHHSATLFVHRTELLPSRDMAPRLLSRTREAQEPSRYRYRACDSAGSDTSGATRLLGCRQTTVKVTLVGESCGHLHGPALPVVRRYVPPQINRETGLTGEMPPSPSSWPLSVLNLSPLRHHPTIVDSHMLARVCTLSWPGLLPLVPTVSLFSFCV